MENLPVLRKAMSAINDNYLNVQQDILETFVDRGQLRKLAEPTITSTGKRIPGLKLDHQLVCQRFDFFDRTHADRGARQFVLLAVQPENGIERELPLYLINDDGLRPRKIGRRDARVLAKVVATAPVIRTLAPLGEVRLWWDAGTNVSGLNAGRCTR